MKNNSILCADAQVCNNLDTPVKLEYDREREYPVKREHDQKVLQYGRSMIEMLGVLAIVGVLSVGGIAGYSKAMEKFKLNKFINQITTVATNIHMLYGTQTDYSSIRSISTDFNSRNLIYQEGLFDLRLPQVKHAYNGQISLDTGYLGDFSMILTFYNITFPKQSCIEFLTHDWRKIGLNSADVETNKAGCCLMKLPTNVNKATTVCNNVIKAIYLSNFIPPKDLGF